LDKGIVVGSGMLAKAFSNAPIPNNIVIVAAGVADSQEVNDKMFEREFIMLEALLTNNPDSKFVYFSTCSIYQNVLTPYIKHKKLVEEYLVNNTQDYLVCRLPQVVGFTFNNTIVSYFTKSILNNKELSISKNAERQLIDVKDVARIVYTLIRNAEYKSTSINISNEVRIPVIEIASKIAEIIGAELKYKLIDSGEKYDIPCDNLKAFLTTSDLIYDDDYSDKILKNYVTKLVKELVKV
jgi:nucleoside-diphosphate-sugar epimerase